MPVLAVFRWRFVQTDQVRTNGEFKLFARLAIGKAGQKEAVRTARKQGARRTGLRNRAFENVLTAHEVRDEARLGLVKDFVRGAFLANDPVFHHDNHVRKRQCLVLRVCNVDKGNAQLLLQAAQLVTHARPQERIKGGKRFIKQKDGWLGNQRSGKRNALLLPPRELVGLAICKLLHMDPGQHLFGPIFTIRWGDTLHLKAKGDVLRTGHVREKRVILKHHRRTAFDRRQFGNIAIPDQKIAFADHFVTGNHAQCGGFAAPGWADQAAIRPCRDLQINRFNCLCAAIEFRDSN